MQGNTTQARQNTEPEKPQTQPNTHTDNVRMPRRTRATLSQGLITICRRKSSPWGPQTRYNQFGGATTLTPTQPHQSTGSTCTAGFPKTSSQHMLHPSAAAIPELLFGGAAKNPTTGCDALGTALTRSLTFLDGKSATFPLLTTRFTHRLMRSSAAWSHCACHASTRTV